MKKNLLQITFCVMGTGWLPCLAQTQDFNGYQARLSWPVVEKIIYRCSPLKEYLADGDYETYVMVYHPLATGCVRQLAPEGILEETVLDEALTLKAKGMWEDYLAKNPEVKHAWERDRASLQTPKDFLGKQTFNGEGKPLSDIGYLDIETLKAKHSELQKLLRETSDPTRRASLVEELQQLELVIKQKTFQK